MKHIALSQGYRAKVDDSDYEWLCRFTWCIKKGRSGIVYAQRNLLSTEPGYTGMVQMHRQILGLQNRKRHVDHINRDGLDNRRCNLRECSAAQNFQNKMPYRGTSSPFKGVRWHKLTSKWSASISVPNRSGRGAGKQTHLGLFTDEIAAALAYDEAARKHFGEFARPNFELSLAGREV